MRPILVNTGDNNIKDISRVLLVVVQHALSGAKQFPGKASQIGHRGQSFPQCCLLELGFRRLLPLNVAGFVSALEAKEIVGDSDL